MRAKISGRKTSGSSKERRNREVSRADKTA
jgi:hypothetical protein